MFLYGYGPQLLQGLKITIALSLSALAVAFVAGLLAAAAKLSPLRILRWSGMLYTTLIRGAPDLVWMLLLYYGIQLRLNDLTDALGWEQVTIDPFAAGVITLGFIYGAYFAETFRGAFIAVPKGSIEAGYAFGMRRSQVFRRILFPQMMRFALPGIGNNWQVLMKSTALVSILGLNDLVRIADQAGKATYRFFLFMGLTGALYLAIATASGLLLRYLERRYALGVRMAEL